MTWRDEHKDPAYGKAAWKRAREACLRRAGWRCEIRTPGICLGTASEADHVYGLRADPEHRFLQATCRPCHQAKTAKDQHRRRHREPPAEPRTDWGSQ